MIKVSVRNNMTRKSLIVDETNATIAHIFEEAGIEWEGGIVTLSGTVIDEDEMEDLIGAHTNLQACVLNVNRKTANAADILLAEKAIIVRSSVTLGDLKKVSKFKPEALVLTKDDEPVFAVGVTDVSANLNQYGVSFNYSGEDDRPAALTILYTGSDIETYTTEIVGPAVLNLERVEAGIADALIEIDANAELINSKITRV